jgi:hypothetical protein
MTFAVPRPRMAGMQMTLVLDKEFGRLKTRHEGRANSTFAVIAHGNTRRNGLTETLA